ncbi:cation:proton antiporter [uncultured Paracoccus sp.]|uniref:cation:proton antiporter n=1 Tax=uncultured Paracoccus sp. TaxID=189685 RepID=UPI0026298269|nr:cation:proton antiporter [uncultured Paracoccus sp.]
MSYEHFLLLLGAGILGATIMPAVTQKLRWPMLISLPIACLLGGIGTGLLFDVPRIDVLGQGPVIQRVTEMAVILSLTGCGLKLDRPLGLRSWGSTWRLLGITMPLCIAAMTLASWSILGLPLAAALLLAAATAPTDPVLASSVQVGPPGEEEEAEARFALTSEAGLNDGLAFPFIYLALAAAAAMSGSSGAPGDEGRFSDEVIRNWLVIDVAWKIVAGTAVGWLVGRGIAWLAFRVAPPNGIADAFLAIGLTFVSYSLGEVANGYGFLSVFVAALTFRRYERNHKFHVELHHFVEQVEQLFLIGVIFATGVALAQGLLIPIRTPGLVVVGLFLAVIRPVAGWIGLIGNGMPRDERFAVSVLGIRGVGGFYYLAYGLSHGPFSIETGQILWGVTALIVAVSVVLHGLTAPAIMDRLTGKNRPS